MLEVAHGHFFLLQVIL